MQQFYGHSAILGRRKNPLIPEAQASESFSAARRIAFSQFRPGIEKAKVNPEHPVNPVEIKPLAEKTIEDVLLHFGDTKRVARRRYSQFIKNGIEQSTRQDLQGGGRGKGDERILGSGDFVAEILNKSNEHERNRSRIPLDELAKRVVPYYVPLLYLQFIGEGAWQ